MIITFFVRGIFFFCWEGLFILFNAWSYDTRDAMDTMIVFTFNAMSM